MRDKVTISLSTAALGLSLLVPQLAQAGAKGDPEPRIDAEAGANVAMGMVPAEAVVEKPIDAKNIKADAPVQIRIAKAVQLKNGPKLPSGTVLMGTADAAEGEAGGGLRLKLNFTEADLKDGSKVPVKATIVGVFAPTDEDADGNPVVPGTQALNSWNAGTLRVDMVNALSGVDLHSAIADDASGTLVATRKRDVKLDAGSEIALAIGSEGSGK